MFAESLDVNPMHAVVTQSHRGEINMQRKMVGS